jgi:hypothetical protein
MHIQTALSNTSIAYRNDMYIADQVFPNVPVRKAADKYFIFDKVAWFRNEAGPRDSRKAPTVVSRWRSPSW